MFFQKLRCLGTKTVFLIGLAIPVTITIAHTSELFAEDLVKSCTNTSTFDMVFSKPTDESIYVINARITAKEPNITNNVKNNRTEIKLTASSICR